MPRGDPAAELDSLSRPCQPMLRRNLFKMKSSTRVFVDVVRQIELRVARPDGTSEITITQP